MSTDLGALIRRRKPERRTAQLQLRNPSELISADAVTRAPGRPAHLADTTVYIHYASARLPSAARDIVRRGLQFHCSVCLSELATGLANRDTTRPRWSQERDHYIGLFDRIPPSRLLVPDDETWADAGLIAGALARTQGFQAHQRKECLNDALIYLTAAKAGLPVLTANRDQFDLIQQLAPEGGFIHY